MTSRRERLKRLGDEARRRLEERAAQATPLTGTARPPLLGHFADDDPDVHASFADDTQDDNQDQAT